MAAGIYLHIPFCKSRCSYCDFATDVYRSADAAERYVRAICREIEAFEPIGGSGRVYADTVYFGGGTPSLLTPLQVKRIMTSISSKFSVRLGSEITMEMNPATVSPETLSGYRQAGVDRASFGVQTFNDRDLRLLARGHDANDARQTYRLLREAGFTNVSLDLIAGLPGQTLNDWKYNLEEAIAMQPEHISLYLLEIHEATPLAEQIRSGRRMPIDDELAAQMYEMMLDRLADSGYVQYEISNFSKPGYRSKHNTKYWRLDPVYGFGVSAHSFDGRERYSNERDTARYIGAIESDGSAQVFREVIDQLSEFVFLGLRLSDGIDLHEYEKRFNNSLQSIRRESIEDLSTSGLIEVGDHSLRLTRKGMLFSNEVFERFI